MILGLSALLLGASAASAAHAQTTAGQQDTAKDSEASVAEDTALRFVSRYDDGDLGDLYDNETSASFKVLVPRANFIQQGGYLRLQSGGTALARELMGSSAMSQLPTGQTGTFRYVRFRASHPNGLVFEDVYLDRANGSWKVMGFYLLPAPQQ